MRLLRIAPIKSLALIMAVIAIFAFGQGSARADEVTIAGSTTGTFSGTTPGLIFAGNSFNVTTSSGFAALSGLQRLGTFFQIPNQGNLNGNFTLTVNFTLPTGLGAAGTTNYTATVTGNVGTTNNGGAQISFNNPVQSFNFNNGTTIGSFTLTLPNFVGVTSGNSVELSGVITGAQQQNQVPEPATILLLGTGLTGLAGVARRRMKRARAPESDS